MPKHMLFIVNAHAGKGQIKNCILPIIDQFNAHDYAVEVYSTQSPGDATRIAADRGARFDLVMCSGGDGTLNETVSGLMQIAGNRPVLGYIPAGSTNDFANNLYPNLDIMSIVGDILGGKPYTCDVGGFNDRFFVYCAAFGAFVNTSFETPQINKNILGRLAYFLEGTKHLNTLKANHLVFKLNGSTIDDDFLYGMVTNSDSIAGVRGFGGFDVHLNDGLFEVLLIKMPRNLLELRQIIAGLIKLDFSPNLFYSFKTDSLQVESQEEMLIWTLDGENGGETRTVKIQNITRAITFMAGCPD